MSSVTKRRRGPKGRGHLRCRPDGRWEAWVDLGTDPNTGKRCRPHLVANTVEELEDKIADLKRARRDGSLFSGRTLTGVWLTHWLDSYAATLANSTFQKHRWAIETHWLKTRVADVVLTDLTAEHLEYALREMKETRSPHFPLSAASQQEALNTIHNALGEAVRRRRITINPAAHVRLQPVPQPEIEPLTTDEIEAVVDVCKDRWNGVRWIGALIWGLRQSEVLGLWWSDIDWDTKVIRIHLQLARQSWRHGCRNPAECKNTPKNCPHAYRTERWRDTTKTKAGRRTLPLDDQMIELLKEHRRRQKEQRLLAGSEWSKAWDDEPWIFTTRVGTPVDHRHDLRDWTDVLNKAKIRPARIHDLRHSAATLLLLAGIDRRVVQELLGWSRSSMADRYQHPVDALKVQASSAIADQVFKRRRLQGG